MQTMHQKTSGAAGNIIDLAELRRRQAREAGPPRRPEAGPPSREGAPAFRPVVLALTPEERLRARRERRAWRLDACASLAVILMTAVFALRMLL